jgi:DNA-binding MarR family transcriptional regulator
MTATTPLDTKPANLTPQETSPAVSLRVAVTRIYRALRMSAENNVTPSQASALARIEQTEPVRLGVLAHLEGVSAASMSKVVESLEAQDLLVRVPDPLDGRVSMVQISPTGRKMIQELRSASTRAIEGALDSMSADEQLLINASLPVLEKLSEILQARQGS